MVLVINNDFARAVEFVLSHEGGYAENPSDRGGVTKYGISLRFLKNLPDGDLTNDGVVDVEDVQALSRDQAIDFYWREFWHKYDYDRIAEWGIAAKLLDMAVNMGPGRAHRLAQQGLWAVGKKLTVDGKLGQKTLQAINASNRDALLAVLRAEAAAFYRLIVAKDQTQKTFLNGWLNRAYA
jgi:lysozyme family protein